MHTFAFLIVLAIIVYNYCSIMMELAGASLDCADLKKRVEILERELAWHQELANQEEAKECARR